MPDQTTVLRVSDARKRFRQTEALRGASVELRAGEWLGLLGPNGAGKTTLIRAIAGRVQLDGGSIELFGRTLGGDDAAARRRIGIVPQDIALYPALTARENLAAFGALCGVTGAELPQRVDWALDWTGLRERAREPIQNFSGGMKRRLNIACAVLHKPEIVLLDEPSVGVDPQSRERIWEMCDGLRRAGAALLLTTHQLDEAQQVCERIVIVDHGRTIAAGTFDQLVAQTIGAQRLVTLTCDRPPPPDLLGDGVELSGSVARFRCRELAADLAAVLARAGAGGVGVQDVQIAAPSLHAVFLHLTGRELRE